MDGPEHVREALRLAELAEQERWETNADPSDDERHRMLLRAHLHASLARTAALTDSTTWSSWSNKDGMDVKRTYRDRATQDAWHEQFDVKS